MIFKALDRWRAARDRTSRRRQQRLKRQGKIPVPANADDPKSSEGRTGRWRVITSCAKCGQHYPGESRIDYKCCWKCGAMASYGAYVPKSERSHFFPDAQQRRIDRLKKET